MKTVALLIFIALGRIASATPSAPSAEDLYTEGQTAYDRADYPTAIARWQAAYDLSGASALLFNLAQALRLSGDCPRALSTYKKFINVDPDPTSEQHKLAEDLAQELSTKCPESPPIVPQTQTPDAGPNLVPPLAVPIGQPGPRSANKLRLAALTTGGVGVGLFVTGLLVGHHANTLSEEVTAACAISCDWSLLKDKDSAGRRDASIGYMIDAVGITAIASGAIMYYLSSREPSISIAPTTRDGGAVLSWSGSW